MAFTKGTLIICAVALLLFGAAVVSVHTAHAWRAQGRHLATALLGLLLFVFADEVSEYGGRHGWTRGTWRQEPAWLTKFVGVVLYFVGINHVLRFV